MSSSTWLITLSMAGNIALLLWGSYTVREAVEKAYSARIGAFLTSASESRFRSFMVGVVSSTALQSATATILLVTSFMTSGLLTLPVALVLILGADVGSAIAVRVLFLDISFLSPLLLCVGLLFHRLSKTWRKQQLGKVFAGLGLMLLSIQLMKITSAPLSDTPIRGDVLSVLSSAPFLALVAAAFVTWLAHSSVAIVLIIASLSQSGLLPPSLSLAMLLGANIGAGMIALFLVSKRHEEAYSAVLANFLMRCGFALICFFLSSKIIENLDRLGSMPGEQMIYLHLLFNVVLALLFIPFNQQVSRLSRKLASTNDINEAEQKTLPPGRSLDHGVLNKPKLALNCARREAFRLADNTEALFTNALQMFEANDRSVIHRFIKQDKEINNRNKAIHHYLAEARRHMEEKDDEKSLDELLSFSTTMENIGDLVSHGLARLAGKKIDRGVQFSSAGVEEINSVHQEVLTVLQLEIALFTSPNKPNRKALKRQMETAIKRSQESIANHQLRLTDRMAESIGTSSIHQDMIRDLIQVINYIQNRHAIR